MGSSGAKPVATTTVISYDKKNVKGFVDGFQKSVIKEELDVSNIYELFALERYCDMSAKNKAILDKERKRLLRIYHPDRNVNVSAAEKNQKISISQYINLSADILNDPDKKRRHDEALRANLKEQTWHDKNGTWLKWTLSMLTAVSGVVMTVAGVVTLNPVLVVAGSACLSSGISMAMKAYKDPSCSYLEFGKNALTGAAGGAIAGGVGLAIAPAIAAATLGAQVGIAFGAGAAQVGAAYAVKDGTDLLINAAGGHSAITDCKKTDEILSLKNAAHLVGAAVVGGLAGAAAQGVVGAIAAGSSSGAATETAQVSQELVASAQTNIAANAARSTSIAIQDATLQASTKLLKATAHASKSVGTIFAEKLAVNAAKEGVEVAGHYAVDVTINTADGLVKGKTFKDALTEANKHALKELPERLIGGAIGLAAGSVIETVESASHHSITATDQPTNPVLVDGIDINTILPNRPTFGKGTAPGTAPKTSPTQTAGGNGNGNASFVGTGTSHHAKSKSGKENEDQNASSTKNAMPKQRKTQKTKM